MLVTEEDECDGAREKETKKLKIVIQMKARPVDTHVEMMGYHGYGLNKRGQKKIWRWIARWKRGPPDRTHWLTVVVQFVVVRFNCNYANSFHYSFDRGPAVRYLIHIPSLPQKDSDVEWGKKPKPCLGYLSTWSHEQKRMARQEEERAKSTNKVRIEPRPTSPSGHDVWNVSFFISFSLFQKIGMK